MMTYYPTRIIDCLVPHDQPGYNNYPRAFLNTLGACLETNLVAGLRLNLQDTQLLIHLPGALNEQILTIGVASDPSTFLDLVELQDPRHAGFLLDTQALGVLDPRSTNLPLVGIPNPITAFQERQGHRVIHQDIFLSRLLALNSRKPDAIGAFCFNQRAERASLYPPYLQLEDGVARFLSREIEETTPREIQVASTLKNLLLIHAGRLFDSRVIFHGQSA